jgi:protein-S-isoprenylcysteine O-methyltransferase Ste14
VTSDAIRFPTGRAIGPGRVVLTLLYLLLWPAMLFLLAGDIHWIEGWLFSGWFVALCVISTAWLYRKNPELLAERYRRPGSGGQAGWDVVLVYLLLLGFTAWMAIMPLDGRRFRWTAPWPLWVKALGGAMLLASWLLIFRSFTDNPFLSPLVRLQLERRQRVIATGVYGFVRHPMYLGALLMFFGAPLLLDSSRALIVADGLTLLLGVRILGEERLLTRELDGYKDYRRRVRYRLLPPLW